MTSPYSRPWPSDIVVLGGSSLVADYLLPRLAGRAALVVAARRRIALPPGADFLGMESLRDRSWRCMPGTTVISLLPLGILIELLSLLESAGAVIALGSTSRFSKASSPDPAERALAEALAQAEGDLAAWAARKGTSFTLLRPTLVYDMARDRNLARMAGFIRRFGMLPVARPASGLRQPIHADDVARAILGAIGNPDAQGRCFNIAGGERLTYRAMAERVFTALGRRPRLVPLPVPLLRLAFRGAAALGIVKGLSFGSSVFQRMNEDLIFEVDDGLRVLGYAPRLFDPSLQSTAAKADVQRV